jgi:hypothetical protein
MLGLSHRVHLLHLSDTVCAGATDRSLFQAEQAFASAKEEAEFYMASLQALTLFKSKSERALLDMQSRAEGAQREAAGAKARYEQARLPSCKLPVQPVLRMLLGM